MNAEQLNLARLARWSQNGEARLTLEAATEWLNTIGFCPYLPDGSTNTAPTASFLEAIVGRPAQSPSASERSRAGELLARMITNFVAVPLKLGTSLGEQPDFIASPEVLRYLYALRGDRNFKTGPSTAGNDKVTPLALHCWQAILEQGPLDVAALQPVLGRDITEAAIARALQELWTRMYVFPVLSASGQPAKWELLSRGFSQQVAAGAATGQAESQSAMISLYLYAVVAAAEEEILAFLSPLAPQSKLREVIRGLGSMRQLDILDIGGRAHVCLQGGLLPEMVAQLSEEQLGVVSDDAYADAEMDDDDVEAEIDTNAVEPEIVIERAPMESYRARESSSYGEETGKPRKFVPKKFVPRKPATESPEGKRFVVRASADGRPDGGIRSRDSRGGGAVRPRSGKGADGGYGASGSAKPSFAGRSFSDRSSTGRSSAGGPADRKPSTRGLGEKAKRWEKAGGSDGERPDKEFGSKPPFRSAGSKSFGPKSAGPKFAGSRPAKPWASKSAGRGDDRPKPWAKKTFGAGGGTSRAADGEERPKRWEKPGEGTGAPRTGFKKPYAAKSAGFQPGGFKPRGAKPWTPRGADSSSTERPKRWVKSGAAGGERGESGGKFRPRSTSGAKPWAAKTGGKKRYDGSPASAEPVERRPWKDRPEGSGKSGSGGGKPRVSRDAEPRSSESRPKGAESRVGSARAYSARSAKGSADFKPRGARGSYARGEAADKPKRREKPEGRAGEKSGGKPKPFWAKNPRGGKGSVAASRTNRPRGGKPGGKKSGKKK